ncbi:hypothetical protein [Paenibacillus rhizolycopersici]|uniref:hypothetical protein n=1 Tax=Paenibacillus rhizolycopersici TaxID=2780073 RepID=UPI003D28DA1F
MKKTIDYFQEITILYELWEAGKVADREFIEKFIPMFRRMIIQMNGRIDNTMDRIGRNEESIDDLGMLLQETEIALGIAHNFIKSHGLLEDFWTYMNQQIEDAVNSTKPKQIH